MSQSKLDMDQDGKITQQELEYVKAENEDKRQDQQRRMASVAMWSMIVVTCVLLSPIVPIERIESLVGIMTTFYLSQAAVVSAFFGATAYLNRD
jgi:hypothetical protein